MTILNVPGVYKLEHIYSGKCYIGSTNNLRRRYYEHRKRIRGVIKGRKFSHTNSKLDDVIRESKGVDCFKFSVLLICDECNLLLYEQLAFEAIKPELNIVLEAGSCPFIYTGTNRNKARETIKNKVLKGEYVSPFKGKVFSEDAKNKQRETIDRNGGRCGINNGHYNPELDVKYADVVKLINLGMTVTEACMEAGMSRVTYYKRKNKQ